MKLFESLNKFNNKAFLNKNLGISHRFLGFTLSEVLITLGIIGVVAGFTIPTLLNTIQEEQFKQSWRKEYALVQQVINQIYTEDGQAYTSSDYPVWSDTPKYFCKMLNRMKVLKSGLNCTDEDNPVAICVNNSTCYWHQRLTYSTISGAAANHNIAFDMNSAILADGALLRFDSMNNFWVDVNGYKKPNTIGKDIFYFLLSLDGKNKPYFWGVVDAYNNSSPSYTTITEDNYVTDCQSGTGWGCSAMYILND